MRVFLLMIGVIGLTLPGLVVAKPLIMVFGDSLSAAYNIEESQGWVSLLEKRLQAQGYPYQVKNLSISGETSEGGKNRLPAALAKYQPAIVILQLGANDGLRALSFQALRRNLSEMIEKAQQSGAKVLLAGVRLPPNLGPVYTRSFQQIYQTLAQQHRIALVPLLLQKVAENPDLIQKDGLHPTAAAQPQILENVWPVLVTLLDKTEKTSKKAPASQDVVDSLR